MGSTNYNHTQPSRSLPVGDLVHITLRCSSRQLLISKRIRRGVLLVVFDKAKQKHPFRLVGICWMANQLHLLVKPHDAAQLPRLMHWMGWYAPLCCLSAS